MSFKSNRSIHDANRQGFSHREVEVPSPLADLSVLVDIFDRGDESGRGRLRRRSRVAYPFTGAVEGDGGRRGRSAS